MNDLKEKLDFHTILRLAAGGYLIYLGYSLIKGVLEDGDAENPVVFILAAVAFVAIGAALIIMFVVNLIKDSAKSGDDEDDAVDAIIAETTDGENTDN